MTTTRIGAAIDALTAFFAAALPGVTVLDGDYPRSSFPTQWLVVGGTGQIIGDEPVASSQQRWAGLGNKTRDEDVTVTCAAGAWSGSASAPASFKTVRDSALTVLGAAEQSLRNDPSLGGITQGGCEMSTAELHHLADSAGVGAAFVFTVTVPFRLEK